MKANPEKEVVSASAWSGFKQDSLRNNRPIGVNKYPFMKRIFSNSRALLFALLMVPLFQSCENDWMFADSVTGSYSSYYAQFYRSLPDFTNGTNKFTGRLDSGNDWHFSDPAWSDEQHFNRYAEPLYCDYRRNSGESNWGDPKVQLDDINLSKHTQKWPYETDLDMYIYMKGTTVSPPAHLHLCLHSWNEAPDGVRPGRTWKVSTIVDDQGKDLTGDPDWTYYTDNTMRFEKTDRFVFTPGDKRSAKELELFGTASEHPTVIGSYTVTRDENGTVKLSLVFPNFTNVLTVVESDYGYLKVSGESGGKKGVLELSPLD